MAGRFFLVLFFCCVLFPALLPAGSGTTPKAKAADYPASAEIGATGIGAEYMVRSFTDGKNWFLTDGYLVVEVAIFPPRREPFNVSTGAMTLRVNNKKQELFAQSPGLVAAGLKYPDWEQRPSLEAGAGPVILGRRQPVPRYPDDRRPDQGRFPQPPTTPTDNPGGVQREAAPRADEVVVEAALPEGEAAGPVSGYVYFAWRGKPKSIKSLELIYRRPDGSVTVLKLI